MINGSYFFGSNKINLENETKSFKNFNFTELFKKTGIRYVYRTNENETSLSLAVNAVKELQKNINSKEIDSLIFVSQSPVSTIPSAGSLLHKQLELKNECFVLDVVQGCSGFPYALSIAVNFLKNKQFKNCLIVCSETYTKYIDKSDKVSMPIFSDAASAIFVDQDSAPKMLSSYFLTDGNGAKNLCLNEDKNLFMHGANVFTFTADKVPLATNRLLEKAKLNIDDVKFFIFHQASAVVLDTIKKKLNIPDQKFYYNIESIGNTVSSTIPIALIMAEKEERIPKKEPILIMGFGVGYSLSGGIFIFD
jgi:3-oxoacyl-[acyl-carrier-protein] synthase-3|tara:strand:- start:529 stop:1449 length:921 start_codon:yes stop_codon:yes gene_type:complete